MNIVHSSNFCVVEESKNFWGVYEFCGICKVPQGPLITSGQSLSSACKKMKLLQTGYDLRKDIDDERYSY